ncbi:MAG: tRNA pseudouridine(55) synthase TruB [Bacteroidota bacterium]|nr:tRNA pseudouridine(55) synthase TruB [Bacteroidota bacterium]
MDFEQGVLLLIDKPLRWTSFDVVKKVKGISRAKKVGHAGTLDPLATGLLILCTGKMTRKIDDYQAQEKEYTGSFTLGVTTPCYDREQPEDATFPTAHITSEAIYAAAKVFTGTIQQTPPPHSAIKIGGKKAYELARKGKEVIMKQREVSITVFEITDIQMPVVSFKVVCSKGTYIRSLAHDFGKYLQSGACLQSLCRTRIGSFMLADALSLEDFSASVKELNTNASD